MGDVINLQGRPALTDGIEFVGIGKTKPDAKRWARKLIIRYEAKEPGVSLYAATLAHEALGLDLPDELAGRRRVLRERED